MDTSTKNSSNRCNSGQKSPFLFGSKEKNMNQQHPIFIYGTLLPHEHNHALFGRHIAKIEPAIFRGGSLLDCGAYPVLLEGAISEVWGVLVTIKPSAYQTILAKLDRLEGYNPQRPSAGFYRRELRSVWLGEETATPIQAHIYIGNPHFIRHRSLSLVPNGRWLPYARMKRERPLLPLGRITCTPSIVRMGADTASLLCRHQCGDWGEVGLVDWHANEIALRDGERIVSVYYAGDTKLWIITEADRSFTTLLLPEEY